MDGRAKENFTRTGQRSLSAYMVVIDSCLSEAEKAKNAWSVSISERPKHISADAIRTITDLCLVSSALTAQGDVRNVRRIEKLRSLTDALIKSLAEFISRQDCEQDKVDMVLVALSNNLPNVTELDSLDQQHFAETGTLSLSLHVSKSLEKRRRQKEYTLLNDRKDIMDIDDGLDSQEGDYRVIGCQQDIIRMHLASACDCATLRASVASYAYLVACAFGSVTVNEGTSDVPSAFFHYLESLTTADLCASGPFLTDLSKSDLPFAPGDANSLIVHLGSCFLEDYGFERCEVAIGLCIEVMTGFANMWTNNNNTDLFSNVSDMYEWVINVAMKAGISSPYVQIRIADILHCLLKIKPDYGQPALPSARTSLFVLLKEGEIPVKYHVARNISDIFELFVLAKHEAIFNDVHENLPKEIEWHEGISIRLLLLTRLAAAWHTLLRRCVYHIFEAAGMITACQGHAAYCITEISQQLRLGGPSALLKLFAPQLLYSWLETQPLLSIPYMIFGYSALVEFLRDVQDEVVGQVNMRGSNEEKDTLAALLGKSRRVLLEESFGKAVAYSIAWDTCRPPSRSGSLGSSEAQIRAELGKDQYFPSAEQYHPYIAGVFFCSMQDVDHVEKALTNRPGFAAVDASLTEMKGVSSSKNALPADQQPNFPSRYIIDQLERLCRRIGKRYPDFWTPELFVYVLRMLLDTIHPAMGSLHTCSVVRRIRALIVLAGSIAESGYALEMALHSLQPLLTDGQCAEDALGVMQYLFSHGKPYLEIQLPFVTGISVSTLISLHHFLGSRQDSTTQESQHVATMTKAQAFHTWLVSYLASFRMIKSEVLGHENEERVEFKHFQSMVRAAGEVRSAGNAREGTPESTLLLLLLDDQKHGQGIMTRPMRTLALHLLCQNFEHPPPYREDVVGDDEKAQVYVPQVFQSCRQGTASAGYLQWAARLIGRAYTASGQTYYSPKMINYGTQAEDAILAPPSGSRPCIITALTDLLLSSERHEAGIAEATLRMMQARVKDNVSMKAEFEDCMSEAVAVATSLPVPDRLLGAKRWTEETVAQSSIPANMKTLRDWVRDLAISMTRAVPEDPVVSCLPHILWAVPDMAQRLFPCIIHLVLQHDMAGSQGVRITISEACHHWFVQANEDTIPYASVLLDAVLYLRKQPIPRESSPVDRDKWLDIDHIELARAASTCGMPSAALLFAETASHSGRGARRTSSVPVQADIPANLLLHIYKALDEPDAYYGVAQNPDLTSVLDRLEYEADGYKSLLFRGARLDSQMRRTGGLSPGDTGGVVKSLIDLNMNSLSHALLSDQHFRNAGSQAVDNSLYAARRLEQWDIRAPEHQVTEASVVFSTFQNINNATDISAVRNQLDAGFLRAVKTITKASSFGPREHSMIRALAVLTEMDEVLSCTSSENLRDTCDRFKVRQHWMQGAQ